MYAAVISVNNRLEHFIALLLNFLFPICLFLVVTLYLYFHIFYNIQYICTVVFTFSLLSILMLFN